MSDIRVQYVSRDIAAAASTATIADADADFVAVADVTKTMLLPAGSFHFTAGLGYVSGTTSDAWRHHLVSADLTAVGALTFTRGVASGLVARAAIQFVEYIGASGGPNAFIRRHKETLTLAAAASSVDSGNISGIVDVNDCYPQAFAHTDLNGNGSADVMCKVDIVDVSGNKRVRVSRGATSGNITAVVYVTEFVGTNWTVQRVAHTFSAAATNEDETISSVTAATSFVLRTHQHASGGLPSRQTVYVRQNSATVLRHRAEAINSSSSVSWVITNSQLAVQHLGTPDGTDDWNAGASPQTQNTTVTTVDTTQAAAIGQAGSDDGTATNNPCALWGFRLSTNTNLEARRGTSTGNSEYVLQSLDFAGLLSGPQIDSITPIHHTESFTITGARFEPAGTDATVALSGVAQTVTASSSTSITCTGVRGTLKYGQEFSLVVTDSIGNPSNSFPAGILPPDGYNFVDLSSLATSGQRITATADLAVGDQLTWGNVVGGEISDVTVEPDASFYADEDVTDFDVQANDGTGWGTLGVQTLEEPGDPPELVGTIGDYEYLVGDEVQLNLGPFATGAESADILGTLPPGLEDAFGVLIGVAITPGDYPLTVRFTNTNGDTDSNEFVVTITALTYTRSRVKTSRVDPNRRRRLG